MNKSLKKGAYQIRIRAPTLHDHEDPELKKTGSGPATLPMVEKDGNGSDTINTSKENH